MEILNGEFARIGLYSDFDGDFALIGLHGDFYQIFCIDRQHCGFD